jgi:hypothetical protein
MECCEIFYEDLEVNMKHRHSHSGLGNARTRIIQLFVLALILGSMTLPSFFVRYFSP